MQKILVVNVNWLGDIIFSTPVFKALKKRYPGARVSCLAVPRVKEILECVPGVDEVIVYDEKGRDRGLFAKTRLIARLKQEKFDAAFLLHGSWTRALLVYLAGIPVRVGHTRKKGRFLTHGAPFPGEEKHKSDVYLSVIEAFGVPVPDRACELSVSEQAKEEIVSILANEGIGAQEKFVVVHTSGNWGLKRWPKENWAGLIRRLSGELKIKVVISEGPAEIEWAEEVARLSAVKPVVLAGKTDLKQLVALLARADLVISADSGPLHIASCVNHNVIGIFGPTMPATTGPRGKARAVIFHKDVGCNRASCYYLACPDNICMKAVTVDEVFEKVKSLMCKV